MLEKTNVRQRKAPKSLQNAIAEENDDIGGKSSSTSLAAAGKILETTSKASIEQTIKRNLNDDNVSTILTGFMKASSKLIGLVVMIIVANFIAWYFQMLHENMFWFSNIKEVEREISFRTEQGLYYSYYKQLVASEDFTQGLMDLKVDNITENGRSVNILQRFNIYQEVVLAGIYKYFNVERHLLPIYFYTKSVFFLQAFFSSGIFLTAWSLGKSWLAGALAICWLMVHKPDASRVDYSVPLRECFSIPFLFCQMAALTSYLKPHLSKLEQNSLLLAVTIFTFLYTITWQFAQFISLLQLVALYGLATIYLIPKHKVIKLLCLHMLCLLVTYYLQYGNSLLVVSLVTSFIPVASASLILQNFFPKKGISNNLIFAVMHILSTACLTIVLNNFIKFQILETYDDQHIFKFVKGKLGFGDPRDFESSLYLCNDAFRTLDAETFLRLSTSTLFPFYCIILFFLLTRLVFFTLVIWELKTEAKKEVLPEENHYSQLAYHAAQAVLFSILGTSALRMKCIWVPHICITAAAGISHPIIWKSFSFKWIIKYSYIVRRLATALLIIYFVRKIIPHVYEQMEDLNEFWDPDTVELMEWIKHNTPATAAFAGSMQLLASLKLCTGRPITNHPHFEDHWLRKRSLQIYQIYAHQPPRFVNNILRDANASYVIIENGICLSSDENHCQLVDIIDLHNGHIPELGDSSLIAGLVKPTFPRFCDQIQYGGDDYVKLFRFVFSNKTFRVYKVLI